MRVISRRQLREFWEEHQDSQDALKWWEKVTRSANWSSFAELARAFPQADQVGRLTVFNVGGNKFRLAARVVCHAHLVYIRRVMTHKEYDKGDWKQDPWASS